MREFFQPHGNRKFEKNCSFVNFLFQMKDIESLFSVSSMFDGFEKLF